LAEEDAAKASKLREAGVVSDGADVAQTLGLTLADHGAGKSYLGFIVYDLFFKALSEGFIYGIETRAELVEASRALAPALGLQAHGVCNTSVAESSQSDQMPANDVVTALHACDTATDDAIAFGLAKQAQYMALVPCCQAEVAARLRQDKALQLARTPLARRCGATPCTRARWAANSPM
jgi:hypothetical protein